MSSWLSGSAANHTAIVCPNTGPLSYEGLENLASSMSFRLRNLGVGEGDRIVICAQKSAHYIAGIIAILDCGATYVPIYERTPQDRVRKIIDDCQPKLALVDELGDFAIEDLTPTIDLCTEDDGNRSDNLDFPGESLCYLLYTSGSTGTPKGVMVPRSSVNSYAAWARAYFELNRDSVVLCTAPLYFDMSVFDIFATLVAGGTIVLAAEKQCLFPKTLIDLIEENRVTHWKGVSSLLQYVAQVGAVEKNGLQSLKSIVFSGERLPTKYLVQWMNCLPDRHFYNAYGPTETTGVSACYRIDSIPDAADPVPIGFARTGTSISVLRPDHSLCDPTEVGEIAIAGEGLADGYWMDPQSTKRSFVNIRGTRTYLTGDLGFIDAKGRLNFRERKDRQVKIQGYRVELGDVSGAALAAACVVDAAATTLVSKNDIEELALAVQVGQKIDANEIRRQLVSQLPKYMVPKHIAVVENIPRSERGKVDYIALKKIIGSK